MAVTAILYSLQHDHNQAGWAWLELSQDPQLDVTLSWWRCPGSPAPAGCGPGLDPGLPEPCRRQLPLTGNLKAQPASVRDQRAVRVQPAVGRGRSGLSSRSPPGLTAGQPEHRGGAARRAEPVVVVAAAAMAAAASASRKVTARLLSAPGPTVTPGRRQPRAGPGHGRPRAITDSDASLRVTVTRISVVRGITVLTRIMTRDQART